MRVQDTSLIALLPALAYANALDLAQVSSTTTALTSTTAVDPAKSSGVDAASITTGAGLPASNPNAVQSEIAPGATATILLGEGSKFFSPDTISKAAPGAVIEFRVDGQGERSVASGKFAAPCNNDPSGFYSGKLISSGDDVFQYTVVNGEPVWFFSGIGEQCRQGAVGVINPSYVSFFLHRRVPCLTFF